MFMCDVTLADLLMSEQSVRGAPDLELNFGASRSEGTATELPSFSSQTSRQIVPNPPKYDHSVTRELCKNCDEEAH